MGPVVRYQSGFQPDFGLQLRGGKYGWREDPEAGDYPLVFQEKEFALLSKSPRPEGDSESRALGNQSRCPLLVLQTNTISKSKPQLSLLKRSCPREDPLEIANPLRTPASPPAPCVTRELPTLSVTQFPRA